MKKITCIAIDDEPLALTIIERFCQRCGLMDLSCYTDPGTGLNAIKNEKPDLVFLDIEMNGISGLEIAKELPAESEFIFTTAHVQFAIDGFNLDAVDFLHKPFAYERFQKAVEKALKKIEIQKASTEKASLIVKQEYNNVVIPVKDIIYIKAMENYTKIFRCHKPYVLSRTSLKVIQDALPEGQFVRVHKSYIISVKHIACFSHTQLTTDGLQYEIPIGRTYANDFMNFMKSLENTNKK